MEKTSGEKSAGVVPTPVAMFAAAGNEVYFSEGDPRNIKITEKTDIALMEQMLKAGERA